MANDRLAQLREWTTPALLAHLATLNETAEDYHFTQHELQRRQNWWPETRSGIALIVSVAALLLAFFKDAC